MSEQIECMCLHCGISLYLSGETISLEESDGAKTKVLRDVFCTECSGPLIVIGKAGVEPHYRLE
jgi:hypothetical protein